MASLRCSFSFDSRGRIAFLAGRNHQSGRPRRDKTRQASGRRHGERLAFVDGVNREVLHRLVADDLESGVRHFPDVERRRFGLKSELLAIRRLGHTAGKDIEYLFTIVEMPRCDRASAAAQNVRCSRADCSPASSRNAAIGCGQHRGGNRAPE
jgi:hypothetical protein